MTDGFLSLLLDGRNVLIILIVAPLMLSFIGFYMLSRQNGLPRDVAVLSQLYVFPVKSCSGIKLNTTECTVRGLKYDRCWVIVDSEGKMFSLKRKPSLALVTQEIEIDDEGEATVTLKAPNMPVLTLTSRVHLKHQEATQLTIWRIQGEGIDCGAEAAEWFSSYLGTPGSKVYFTCPENCQPRRLTTDPKYGHLAKPKDEVGFADFAPVLVASEASLDDLNSRLDNPVSICNFRANIIVSGSTLKPFEEDTWKCFKIGNVVLRQLKECDRCVVTTVNPNTGEKNNLEPLKTLRKYRSDPRYGASPMFGLYAAVDVGGKLTVGNKVIVTEV